MGAGHRAAGKTLRSFAPVADDRSRILILGTMPGPQALRRQEYYGFPGNHFWRIMSDLFAGGRPLAYPARLKLMRQNRIALWDVLAACEREGAADSAIRNGAANDIPALLARYPGIGTIFLNGGTAARLFARFFGARITVPAIRLPSTSPAHASMPYAQKLQRWAAIVTPARGYAPAISPAAARTAVSVAKAARNRSAMRR